MAAPAAARWAFGMRGADPSQAIDGATWLHVAHRSAVQGLKHSRARFDAYSWGSSSSASLSSSTGIM